MLPTEKFESLDEMIRQRLSQRNMFNNSLQWKSNISNLNIDSVLKPLSCSNAIVCTQSENIPEENYKRFTKEFLKIDINRKDGGIETKDTAVPGSSKDTEMQSLNKFRNKNAKIGPRTYGGIKTKLSSNVNPGEVLQNLNYNSKIGKSRKYQLEEPDYDDVDLSTVVRKPPPKKKKFSKISKQNNDLEDDFVSNIPNKNATLNIEFKTAKEELYEQQDIKYEGNNTTACEGLQNIDKRKKNQLKEPDNNDLDLNSMDDKKIPTKKLKNTKITKFTKNTIQIKDDIEEHFMKNIPSNKNKIPPLDLEFKTAKEELCKQSEANGKNHLNPDNTIEDAFETNSKKALCNNGNTRKVGNKRIASGKFISPMLSNNSDSAAATSSSKSQEWLDEAISTNSDLKLIEPRMVELIRSEIMDRGPSVDWADIAGLEFAKQAVQEAVVWPMLRPDIFKGLRRPPKGILFFGPPGTGKTLIGKCVASQSKSTFFTISASSMTSKWVGEGEKMVRALFTVARSCQPAVIFIDEVDSLLSQRSDGEHESSRRIKTEFLIQLDGATTDADERLLVIGATNRPQELDEAARRRFTKRLYIPLPEKEARLQLVQRLMANEKHSLNTSEMDKISELSDGFSGADIRNLCSEACLGPIRSIDISKMASIEAAEVPAVQMKDFVKSFTRVRPSVCQKDLEQYIQWDTKYGSGI